MEANLTPRIPPLPRPQDPRRFSSLLYGRMSNRDLCPTSGRYPPTLEESKNHPLPNCRPRCGKKNRWLRRKKIGRTQWREWETRSRRSKSCQRWRCRSRWWRRWPLPPPRTSPSTPAPASWAGWKQVGRSEPGIATWELRNSTKVSWSRSRATRGEKKFRKYKTQNWSSPSHETMLSQIWTSSGRHMYK